MNKSQLTIKRLFGCRSLVINRRELYIEELQLLTTVASYLITLKIS